MINELATASVPLRKIDWHILPMTFLLYIIRFLDSYAHSFKHNIVSSGNVCSAVDYIYYILSHI